jgi:colanic acid/amylovoran biosynthesis glycosyltransferase
LPENVLHEETGWVVPKRNPAALCEKIKAVLAMSHHERQNITWQARERIEQHFTLKDQKQQFKAFFTED